MLKLIERGALNPIFDVLTRWGSCFNMIERLIVLKPIILDFAFNENITLSEAQWNMVDQLEK